MNWDLWLTSEPTEPYFEFDIPAGQTIQWDTQNLRVTNGEAANGFIKRPSYRAGCV